MCVTNIDIGRVLAEIVLIIVNLVMVLVVYVFGHVLDDCNFNFEISRVLGAKIYNQEHDQLSLCGDVQQLS